jgi:Ankyrin repeats (3 copies)
VDNQSASSGGLAWLSTANRWGVRLLDVRSLTMTMLSTSRDPNCAANAVSFRGDDGTSFIGEEPAVKRTIESNLRFPIDRCLADGILFTPREMEQKWAIFYYHGALIFVRSWLRCVQVVASIEVHDDIAVVTAVRGTFLSEDETPEFTLRILDYLIRSHALDMVYPVPLPFDLADDPESAAIWCMSAFGNRAYYATPEPFDRSDPDDPLRTHSLLHISVARGDIAMIESILATGVPVDLLDKDGAAPMHWALSCEDFAPMELLLKCGSSVDVRTDDGDTPLMLATQDGHNNQVLFLLETGADVNAVDLRGFTALHRAAEKGFNDLVGLLLERGAIPRPQAGEHTPRSLAEANGHEAIVELLRRYEDSSGM